MKILFPIYLINNYGGITTYVEELTKGFRELGHTVDLVLLGPSVRKPYKRIHTVTPGSWPSVFDGLSVNPDTGWGGVTVVSANLVSEWKERAEQYDLIVWIIPVPSYSSLSAMPDWRKLYKLSVPQVAIIHDGNFRYLYPHLNAVAPQLNGVACVHGAAYGSAALYNGSYALIPNPHPSPTEYTDLPWEEKKKIVTCVHMWKGWKHMDDAVRSAPYLQTAKLILGGDGIERRYLTSETKAPPKYAGLWSAMMESGNAKYLGIITNKRLTSIYSKGRIMYDPSFSKNYNRLGSHFNRSIFEAYNAGSVPLCVKENMQLPGIFKPGVSHLEIPFDISPKRRAKAFDAAVNISEDQANTILDYGRNLIKTQFNRKKIAKDLIRLANGKPCGLFASLEEGKPNARIHAAAKNILAGNRPKDRCF